MWIYRLSLPVLVLTMRNNHFEINKKGNSLGSVQLESEMRLDLTLEISWEYRLSSWHTAYT